MSEVLPNFDDADLPLASTDLFYVVQGAGLNQDKKLETGDLLQSIVSLMSKEEVDVPPSDGYIMVTNSSDEVANYPVAYFNRSGMRTVVFGNNGIIGEVLSYTITPDDQDIFIVIREDVDSTTITLNGEMAVGKRLVVYNEGADPTDNPNGNYWLKGKVIEAPDMLGFTIFVPGGYQSQFTCAGNLFPYPWFYEDGSWPADLNAGEPSITVHAITTTQDVLLNAAGDTPPSNPRLYSDTMAFMPSGNGGLLLGRPAIAPGGSFSSAAAMRVYQGLDGRLILDRGLLGTTDLKRIRLDEPVECEVKHVCRDVGELPGSAGNWSHFNLGDGDPYPVVGGPRYYPLPETSRILRGALQLTYLIIDEAARTLILRVELVVLDASGSSIGTKTSGDITVVGTKSADDVAFTWDWDLTEYPKGSQIWARLMFVSDSGGASNVNVDSATIITQFARKLETAF